MTPDQAYSIFNTMDLYHIRRIKPSDFAEQNRVMTRNVSKFEGKFSYQRTPYFKELINTLSPDHPARIVAFMKGAQIGASANLIENGLAWIFYAMSWYG